MKRAEFVDILRSRKYKYVDMQTNCCVVETVGGRRIKYYIDMIYDFHEVEDFFAEYKEAKLLQKKGYTVYKLITAFGDIIYTRINNKWIKGGNWNEKN